MSRIGKQPITIPAGVTVTVANGNEVTVKGPKGELSRSLQKGITVAVEGDAELRAERRDRTLQVRGRGRAASVIDVATVG